MSLTFVNRRNAPVSIMVMWHETGCNPPWRKGGWLTVAPGASGIALDGDLNNRYFYFYARASDGSYWGSQKYHTLVPDNNFEACVDQIFEPSRLVPLLEMDTQGSKRVTVNLS